MSDSLSDLSESLCCFWNMDTKFRQQKRKRHIFWRRSFHKESMSESTCNGEKRQRRRKTGTDRQYEEKQEVPERTAYRGRLCRYCRLLRRPSVEYREEKEKDHGRINAGIKKNS